MTSDGFSEAMEDSASKPEEPKPAISDEARIRAMVELECYIKYNLYYGHNRAEIKNALMKAGWSSSAVNEAMKKVAPLHAGVKKGVMPVGALDSPGFQPSALPPITPANPVIPSKVVQPKVLGEGMPTKVPEHVVKAAVAGEPVLEKPSELEGRPSDGELGMHKINLGIKPEDKAGLAEPKSLDELEKEFDAENQAKREAVVAEANKEAPPKEPAEGPVPAEKPAGKKDLKDFLATATLKVDKKEEQK